MGDFCQGEELKSYGEKLSVRIQELEKLIWQEAGEEFNINSPKQLGVIPFLKKMGLPRWKEDQDRLLHSSRYPG